MCYIIQPFFFLSDMLIQEMYTSVIKKDESKSYLNFKLYEHFLHCMFYIFTFTIIIIKVT